VLPVAIANPRSDWGVNGVCGNAMNLVLRATGPHPLYIALPQGPTNQGSVGHPQSGRREGFRSAIGLDRTGDQSNIFVISKTLTTYNVLYKTMLSTIVHVVMPEILY
jgi:hypothetical protein